MNELIRTKILVTRKGKPAADVDLRLHDGTEFRTDAQGQADVTLDVARPTIDVLRDGEWIPHHLDVGRDSSMVILDLARNLTQDSFDRSRPDTGIFDVGKLHLGERYVFQEVLGRGGMSVVLKAHDRILNRPVAVKVLSDELQHQPEAQEIFLTEARSLATLAHPNLVAVHDIGKIDDRVFMVIEVIEGETLEKLVVGMKGFNQMLGLQTGIQLARVVGYLHDKGVLHRDLKPSNAMIRRDGTLKLIDFGLARHFEELLNRGTRVRGTPAYMSPEQILGKAMKSSSDVYQLGVCLFEMFTGRLPFSGGDIGYAHVHTPPPRVESFKPDLDPLIGDLLEECMAKDPLLRPQDGNAVMRRLQQIYAQIGGTEVSLLGSVADISNPSIRRTTNPNIVPENSSRLELSSSVLRAVESDEPVAPTPSPLRYVVIGMVLAIIIGAAIFFGTMSEQTPEMSVSHEPAPAAPSTPPSAAETNIVQNSPAETKTDGPPTSTATLAQEPPTQIPVLPASAAQIPTPRFVEEAVSENVADKPAPKISNPSKSAAKPKTEVQVEAAVAAEPKVPQTTQATSTTKSSFLDMKGTGNKTALTPNESPKNTSGFLPMK